MKAVGKNDIIIFIKVLKKIHSTTSINLLNPKMKMTLEYLVIMKKVKYFIYFQ